MRLVAIVLAAGSGSRAGGALPKQFWPLGGEPVVVHALRRFAAHDQVIALQPVIDPAQAEQFRQATHGLPKVLDPAAGGATRQQSVRAGLEAAATQKPSHVLIHDAARPMLSAALIDRAIDALRSHDAAIPALPVTDTVKRFDEAGHIIETLDRASLRSVQTPQAFVFSAILDAHRHAAAAGRDDFTDDAALAEWAGMNVATFPGDPENFKLTTPEDFARMQALDAQALGDIRSATGFDVHAFGPGDHVILGGVSIPHDRSLTGHSDADVVLHALTDAVLGTIAAGDIGIHFPPSDPQWRGASSDRFLAHAVSLLGQRGGRIAHLDATILCEQPKIAPHADAMRANIARIAGVDLTRVSIKATTMERLGFIGRGEGIAAMATATVRLPWSNA